MRCFPWTGFVLCLPLSDYASETHACRILPRESQVSLLLCNPCWRPTPILWWKFTEQCDCVEHNRTGMTYSRVLGAYLCRQNVHLQWRADNRLQKYLLVRLSSALLPSMPSHQFCSRLQTSGAYMLHRPRFHDSARKKVREKFHILLLMMW